MSQNYHKTGQIGEELATKHLKSKGFVIIERNFAIHNIGEIDIIALKDGMLHFVEVKTSENVSIYDEKHSLLHFDKNKKIRTISMMQRYCHTHNITIPRMVDLIAINISRETMKADIYHEENVYIDTV